jgi:hypothetical protein
LQAPDTVVTDSRNAVRKTKPGGRLASSAVTASEIAAQPFGRSMRLVEDRIFGIELTDRADAPLGVALGRDLRCQSEHPSDSIRA